MQPPYCRLVPFHIADGPWNMAADESLLESAAAGIASLRLYGWSRPTLTLGYFQATESSRSYPGVAELPWLRRPSGGAALVHHLEVTYALALPTGAPWQKRGQSWLRLMHGILREALSECGAALKECGENEEQIFGDVLCFLHHTPGDLLIGSAKVVGSAQRKQRGALVQHGGILLGTSPHTPNLPGINDLSGVSISPESLNLVIVEHFARRTGWQLLPSDWSLTEQQRIADLIAAKYARPSWNCKR
jgi:lipoate-protein ligase A